MPPLKDGRRDNVKPDSIYSLIANVFKNFELRNPIPDEIADIDQIKNLYSNFGWIPFAGYANDSKDTLLRFINNLALLSPTLSSCINGIGGFGFSGKIDLIQDDDYEFDLSNSSDALSLSQDLGNTSKNKFVKLIRGINLSGLSWNKLPRVLYQSYHNTGNSYMSITLTKVAGKWYPSLKFHKPEFCRFKSPNTIVDKVIGISPVWTLSYIKKYPPIEYPVYPDYRETKDEIRTIIHLKEGTDTWYGKPRWWAAALDAFMQIKNKEYLLKAVHNAFSGQVLIELETDTDSTLLNEDEARKEGYKDSLDRLEQHMTAQGDKPSSIVILERPPGASPAHVVSFPINTNEKYYKETGLINRGNIIEVIGWDALLMGKDTTTGFSNDERMSALGAKLPLIQGFQSDIYNGQINTGLDFISIITGEAYNEYKLMGKNPMEFITMQNIRQEIMKQQTSQAVAVTDPEETDIQVDPKKESIAKEPSTPSKPNQL